jgi:hypothetical protein
MQHNLVIGDRGALGQPALRHGVVSRRSRIADPTTRSAASSASPTSKCVQNAVLALLSNTSNATPPVR